ncbi:gp44 [Sphingomonas phage PAU]|uniref:gp44 n=1 Tax=Sphingomonas phage PAU TaxID=1150991 RepID=UPI0002573131|nr:gp44 [Sphingomonas phage PAU]AFF28042.1 gp44 [Sphingomonas phage PAU]
MGKLAKHLTINSNSTENYPKIIHFVFNNHTEKYYEGIVSEIVKLNCEAGKTVIEYSSENIDEHGNIDNRPVSNATIVNLVNYFPESYDYDHEEVLSKYYHSTIVQELIEYCNLSNLILLNVNIDNCFMTALNDIHQKDKIEIFLESKIERTLLLKNSNTVCNVFCSYIYDKKTLSGIISDNDIYLNNRYLIFPITLREFSTDLLNFLYHSCFDIVRQTYIYGEELETMFTFVKNNVVNPDKVHEILDFMSDSNVYNYHNEHIDTLIFYK